MNISVGTDITEVQRFITLQSHKRFMQNIFTQKEMEQCLNKPSPEQSLAARYAAKEAIKKTVEENVRFNIIEILNEKDGKPKVNFLDKQINQKYQTIISLSHTPQYAVAVCLTYKHDK